MTVDVVIASYKEPVDWLWLVPKEWRIFLYNTDESRTEFPNAHLVERIPNGGREAGPWLHHLATQHDNHSDVTLFLQGRPFDHEAHELLRIFHTNDFPHRICYINARPPEKGMMHIQPHGDVEQMLRKGWGDSKIPPAAHFSCGAQFYVRKEVILRRPADHYARILENAYDPTIHSFGHRMEPVWGCVFDWEEPLSA